MKKSYMIMVSSQKGGVGKTTVAVNLAVALGLLNYKVLLIDNDTVSPSVGFCLGISDANLGIRDVMNNKVDIKRALVRHDASGIDVLPGTQRLRDFPKEKEIISFARRVQKLTDYDFVITDTPPGYFFPEMAEFYDEAVIVSIPTMASITSTMRFGEIYDKEHVKHELIINRITSKRFELSMGELEDAYGGKSIAAFPEDPAVPKSESAHIPVYIYDNNAPFSRQVKVLARFYAAKRGGDYMSFLNKKPGGIFSGLALFFRKLLGG
ncbi:MAG: MinD/ParA family protein [Candidatus Micrarchaeota archaeon]|nr:MinD/ParA family protein [Candidatus Micrarchaeota archaeon]MDE1804858.1 MinD/ParA family protein [Candidatus Micrarchaeota archaeon]MDE1847120.1 MinD/ParA family protein [Candidatus Micrarchaeota archaeon]